ncbi:MAG: hypothetical protein V1866_04590 [archaeon]
MQMTNGKKPAEEKKHHDDLDFFMRISDPALFRRNLLESSKQTLGMIREMYTVKQIREMKQERISTLHREFKEIRLLCQKLEEIMPKHTEADLRKHIPEFNAKKKEQKTLVQEPESAPEPEARPKVSPQKASSELDKLALALNEVQRKLSNL